MRVLHLIDQASRQAYPATLKLLAASQGRLGDIDQTVTLLGGSRFEQSAIAAGVEHPNTVGVPFGKATLGWPAVRAALRHRKDGPYDVVHCWSVGTLMLATLMFRRTPRLLTLTCEPNDHDMRWLRALVQTGGGDNAGGQNAASHDSVIHDNATGEHREGQRITQGAGQAVVNVLPISNTIRRTVMMAGIDPAQAHVLRPAIDLGAVRHGQRQLLRESWGIEPADRVKVACLLGDPPAETDVVEPLLAVSLATEMADNGSTDGDNASSIRMLVHPDQANRGSAMRLLRAGNRSDQLIVDVRSDEPWETLPGCDMAIAVGEGGGLNLLWAMSANVPIVGEATYGISEVVEDRHSGLLCQPGDTRSLSERIVQLVEDDHLAWSLRDTARNEAYSFFSRKQYCQNLGLVYRQIAGGEPIAIPDMEVTGGLRFSGRA